MHATISCSRSILALYLGRNSMRSRDTATAGKFVPVLNCVWAGLAACHMLCVMPVTSPAAMAWINKQQTTPGFVHISQLMCSLTPGCLLNACLDVDVI